MQAIFDLFSSLFNGLISLFDIIGAFIGYFVQALSCLFSILGNSENYLSWLPSELVVLLIGGVGVVVVYKFIGREG